MFRVFCWGTDARRPRVRNAKQSRGGTDGAPALLEDDRASVRILQRSRNGWWRAWRRPCAGAWLEQWL